jgi:hypothetical protein
MSVGVLHMTMELYYSDIAEINLHVITFFTNLKSKII